MQSLSRVGARTARHGQRERGGWRECWPVGAMPPVLFPFTPHNSHGTSPYLPPGSQAGARPGDKGQLGVEGKGIPVPSSPEAQDFLGSQLLTLGTRRTLRLRPIILFYFIFFLQN